MAGDFLELNADQGRAVVNTQQRVQTWRTAFARRQACRGSMVWSQTKGHQYLMRVAYDKHGHRRQSSLGLGSAETERVKANFERAREEAEQRIQNLRPLMARQAAINRALGLGRAPRMGARIIRSLDNNGLLGAGIRVLGTNAIYAYEAAAGVHLDSGLTTTEDVDLLLDARGTLSSVATDDLEEASLLRSLQRVDRSFERSREDQSTGTAIWLI